MHHQIWNPAPIPTPHAPPAGLEPGAFSMQTECADQYTTSPLHYPHRAAGNCFT